MGGREEGKRGGRAGEGRSEGGEKSGERTLAYTPLPRPWLLSVQHAKSNFLALSENASRIVQVTSLGAPDHFHEGHKDWVMYETECAGGWD